MKKSILVLINGAFVGFIYVIFCNISSIGQSISYSPWEKVVPSDKLPSDIRLRKANNNLDITYYNNRYYLAFRNAPSHFASKKTRMYVLSSVDLESWQLEKTVHLYNDLREPRFIVYKGTLYFYYFEGGKKPWRFEPKHLYISCRTAGGDWKEDVKTSLDGYIPWRLKVQNGLIYLSAYFGQNAYNNQSVDLRLFTSTNGLDFEPISKQPQILHEKGIGEGEFLFDKEGNIWGVARSEFDGSHTFYANKDSLANWRVIRSDHKFDSSLMFEKDGVIFLIARRNLDGDGKYYRIPGKHLRNLLRYSFTKKTTAIYRLNKKTLSWKHLKDIGGTGDTAFPGLLENPDGSFLIMNYSSKLTGRKKNWICGQLGKTYIYSTLLRVTNE